MNNNLITLENAIYNSIPRLMELSSGCEVKDSNQEIATIVRNYNNGVIAVVYKRGNLDVHLVKDIQILGHPILLNDVLEWLMKNGGFVISNNYLFFNDRDFEDSRNAIKIDWSKSKLSDQSQELIDALCELIAK